MTPMNENEVRSAMHETPGDPPAGLAQGVLTRGHRRRQRRSVAVGVVAGMVAVTGAIFVPSFFTGETAVPIARVSPAPTISVPGSPSSTPTPSRTSNSPTPTRETTSPSSTPKPTRSASSAPATRNVNELPGRLAGLRGVNPPHASSWKTGDLSLKLCDQSPGFSELNRLMAARTVTNAEGEQGQWESVLVFDGVDPAQGFVARAAKEWAEACDATQQAGTETRVAVRTTQVDGAERAYRVSVWSVDVASGQARPGGSQWIFTTAGNVVAVIGMAGEFVGDQRTNEELWGPLQEAAAGIVGADCVNRGTCAEV